MILFKSKWTGDLKENIGTAFYKRVLWPVIRRIDPERAHELTILATKYRLTPVDRFKEDPVLKIQVLGLNFSNPLGLAAGCDKQVTVNWCLKHVNIRFDSWILLVISLHFHSQGEAVEGFMEMGFGAVEVGSITRVPQVSDSLSWHYMQWLDFFHGPRSHLAPWYKILLMFHD